jgi:Spy/CpxP family protein refolding chaperone
MQMRNIKRKVIAAALSVFILGFVAGALTLNLYRTHYRPICREERPPGLQDRIQTLSLTADQKAQVEEIFNDTRAQLRDIRKESKPRVDEVRKQARTRLQAVLTPEQWKQLEGMEKDRRDDDRR